MRENYKKYAWRLEDIQNICNKHIDDIVIGNGLFQDIYYGDDITNVVVRYVLGEDKFGYSYMGDFFFIDDCMYIISDDEKFKDIHNEDIPGLVEAVHKVKWYRDDEYVIRVIFAGVRTPFKDNLGDWIYTGDVVKVRDYIISGVCAFPSHCDDEIDNPDNYGLMLDNHMLPLRDCGLIERLGTIYFDIGRSVTEIGLEEIIGETAQFGKFDKEFLLKARYTPSHEKERWKYTANEILGIEYNWRK